MAVLDYGIEVLKKCAEYVSGTVKDNYYLKTKLLGNGNTELNLETNDSNQLKVVLDGKVCTNNSSSATLLAGQTFTGDASETLDYAIIFVNAYSDVASATDGLCIQVSSDGTTWRDSACDPYTIPALSDKTFSFQTNKKYFRVKYTNGGSDQTEFDLHVVMKKTNSKPSSHRIQDAIIDHDDAELVKSVITGRNPAGTFVNFEATTAGNFKMSLEELENQISENGNTQLKVSNYTKDEYGNYYHMLSDNIFGGAPVFIPPEHHEIHCGDSYVMTRTVDVGNAASDELIIIVPNEAGTGQNQKLYHLVIEGNSEAEGEWYLYESPTYSNVGTSITSQNRNRNSSNTDVLDITHTPTLTTDGTILENFHVGSGKGIGGEGRTDEWVLKNNTTYLVRFTNATTSNNFITWRLNYYVHPGI